MAEIVKISVEELHFDPDNPRIPSHVDAEDEQDVLAWMLEDAGLVELMGSIAAKGYFEAEPILVTEADRGGYLVLEGNRRLAAISLLLEPERAPKRKRAVAEMSAQVVDLEELQLLPCIIFAAPSDVRDYLGFRHITGIKQWEPAAKARYLRSLYEVHLPSEGTGVYKHIARLIGSRSDYVMRLLAALTLYEALADTEAGEALEENDVSFSLLTLALNYTAIVRYLGIESLTGDLLATVRREHLSHLATWLYVERPGLGRTQLGESRNMKLLAVAVGRPEGIAALVTGELVEEAASAALDANEILNRSLRVARDRLLGAQAQLHRAEITSGTIGTLEELAALVENLLAAASIRQRRGARRASQERDADA